MTWTMRHHAGISVLSAVLVLSLFGCGALDVSDPTAIEDEELANATGAELLRGDVLGQFYGAFGSEALETGVLADEFTESYESFVLIPLESVDRRNVPAEEYSYYSAWSQLRRTATVALPKLLTYGSRPHAGEVLAIRGYATLRLAEDFCPGFPSNELIDFKLTYGSPLTTEQALERALADFDTALTYAVDSARVLNFVRVIRADALLGLGRFAEAAVTVDGVPTGYVWNQESVSASFGWENPLVFVRQPFTPAPIRTLSDREGGNGLDFLSAGDPRVTSRPNGLLEDGITMTYSPGKYADDAAPIVVASGIEARLIEAEAALGTGSASWLDILNELRENEIIPAMTALTDPGTPSARLDLLFRERAFWLFATGHRLSDLRRLVRVYGRDPENVFPTGPYALGGNYGPDTSLPFPAALEAPFNPAITGCTGS